jgi:hypothetical protein
MRTYADILLTDLESVRSEIKEKSDVRKNLAETRCIITWEGNAHQCIDDLNCIHRTHAEAQAYYNDPTNGWCLEEEL